MLIINLHSELLVAIESNEIFTYWLPIFPDLITLIHLLMFRDGQTVMAVNLLTRNYVPADNFKVKSDDAVLKSRDSDPFWLLMKVHTQFEGLPFCAIRIFDMPILGDCNDWGMLTVSIALRLTWPGTTWFDFWQRFLKKRGTGTSNHYSIMTWISSFSLATWTN